MKLSALNLSICVLASLAAPLSAQQFAFEQAPGASTETHLSAPSAVISHAKHSVHDRMLYDTPGDGSLWVVGASYKASFDTSGATYYPYFGERAPHDMPHALSPDSVSIGGEQLVFERAAGATRDGDRIAIDRGAFVETYDVAVDSVEQSFVFASLPNRGDLVVHMPVASELQAVESEGGIEFRGELGSVRYGRAVAIDAHGQRSALETHFENGALTIRASAALLARAELPLVIDPYVSTVFIAGGTDDDIQPDVAFDPFTQVWLVTYEKAFSASDHDCYAQMFSLSGGFLAANIIDSTTDSWLTPRCANAAAAHNFLVVAENVHLTTHTIKGRIASQNGGVMNVGAAITISDAAAGNKTAPTVGGDPSFNFPTFWCVAYVQQAGVGSSGSSIAVCAVGVGGTPGAPIFMAGGGAQPDTSPSLSKSDDTFAWLLAWRRPNGVLAGDIWAAHIHFDGTLLDGPFAITAGLDNDFAPCASSPQHGTHRAAIAFASNVGVSTNHEIKVAVLDGTTVLQIVDLNGMEPNGAPAQDQVNPAIDCDGRHFLVTYSEQQPVTGTYQVFGTDLFLSGNTLGVEESHVMFHQFGLDERNVHMCAAHDVNAASHRFLTVYDVLENASDHDIDGDLFDVVEGGTTSLFCAGTNATCPCGNGGAGTNGCANSATPNGAGLSVSGVASTVDDSVVLFASGMPPSTSCLFFQGTTAGSATAFGDGLRCVTGTVVRLATKTANVFGVTQYPAAGDQPVSVRGALTLDGGQRAYQVWYRNAAAFCTSSTFNLSNGVIINWAR